MTADDTFCAYYEVGHGCCLHRDRDCCGRDLDCRDLDCRDLDCRDAVLGLGVDGVQAEASSDPPTGWSPAMAEAWDRERILAHTLAQLTAKEMLFVHGVWKGLSVSSAAAYAGVRVQSATRFLRDLAARHPEFEFLKGCITQTGRPSKSTAKSAKRPPIK